MTQAQYARHRGVARNSVNVAVARGRIPSVGPRKLIDPVVADAAWEANTKPNGNGHATAASTLNAQRAEREGWQAKMARLDYERKAGLLVPAADREREGFEAGRVVRDMVMQVPKDVSSELAPAMTPIEVERLLTAALREALGRAQAALESQTAGNGDPADGLSDVAQ